MRKSSDLTVYQKGKNIDEPRGDVFVVNRMLEQTDIFDILERHYRVQNLNVTSNSEIPIYNIFNEYLARSRSEVGLVGCIVIYHKLQNRVDNDNIDNIYISDCVERKYIATILDFAEENGINIEQDQDNRDMLFLKVIRSLLFLFLFFSRSVIYHILSDVHSPIEGDIVCVPIATRTYHFDTLIEYISDYTILTTNPTEAGLPHPSQLYTHISVRRLTEAFLATLKVTTSEFLINRNFQTNVEKEIEREFDIGLSRTVHYTVANCISYSNIQSLWKYLVYLNVFGSEKPEAILVGGLNMDCKSALLAGEHTGNNTYYLPHSITGLFHPTPPANSTFFTPEATEGEYWEHRIKHSDLIKDRLVETGRVDLQKDFETHISGKKQENEAIQVLLATQPHDDEIREQFVDYILEAANNSPTEFEIKIKIHPGEEPNFYAGYPVSEVLDEDVKSAIDDADIVCTVNSNVGIISMSRKTPVISINSWSPRASPPLYALDGDVPMLESQSEVEDLFNNLTECVISGYMSKQYKYFKKSYYFPDCISTIKEEISKD